MGRKSVLRLMRMGLAWGIVALMTVNPVMACRFFGGWGGRWGGWMSGGCAPVCMPGPIYDYYGGDCGVVYSDVIVGEATCGGWYSGVPVDQGATSPPPTGGMDSDMPPPPPEESRMPTAPPDDDMGLPADTTPPDDTPPADTLPPDLDLDDDLFNGGMQPPSDTAPPADTPPADTPPADTPPADTPPADTPPADDFEGLFGEPSEPATPPANDQPPADGADDLDLFGEPADQPPIGTGTDPEPADDTAPPTEATPDDLFGPADGSAPADDGLDLFGQVQPKPVSPAVRKTADSAHVALPMRSWTDNTGRYHTRGRLIEVGRTYVRLMKDNGRRTTVPLGRLSQSDFQYVQSIVANYGGNDRISRYISTQ